MNIVFLDSFVLNPGDLQWGRLAELGQFTVYDRTPSDQIVERAKDAEVIILNKKRMTEEIFAQLPKLRLILVCATGYDVIDLEAARRHGVTVCNVPAYSTLAVAQHTLALLLDIMLNSTVTATGRAVAISVFGMKLWKNSHSNASPS